MITARIFNIDQAAVGPLRAGFSDGAFRWELAGSTLTVLTGDPDRERLLPDDVRHALILADTWCRNPACELEWAFSGIKLACESAGPLLARWNESGEPPVLEIIALELDTPVGTHRTRGMSAFAGGELAASYADPSQSQEAARALSRLARRVLMHGAVDRAVEWIVVGSNRYRLEFPSAADDPSIMVSISL